MMGFFQAAAAVLVAVFLCLTLKNQAKDFSLLIAITVCCALGSMALLYLQPVFAFLEELQRLGSLDSEMLSNLLKIVGIAFVAEISATVCADSGNGAMGKVLQYLALAVILRLSLPMLYTLLDTLEGILGKL